MKNKKIFILLLLIPIIIFFIGRSFSQLQEVKSVEIQSEDYGEPGSWHIDKSAKWTDVGKARVTFDVNSILKTSNERYKDVILVIDVSGSMDGEKLDRATSDAIELTNYLLNDTHNNVALIVFDTTSVIKSEFTNDKDEMLSLLNSLVSIDCTNYNAALKNVDVIMENYVVKENTDVITLFLTDGYPNEDTPNEVATYHLLKDKYPYMTINGIQYEMGKDIIQEIIDISDNQFVADIDSLHNVLFDATISPINYDNFVITDYINNDYFYVNSVDDIRVSLGEVSLEDENGIQKIIWDLDNLYKTKYNIKMTIDLNLKEEYHDTKGYYPTNKRETIVSKLLDDEEKVVDSELTPILKNAHYVIYDTNTPTDCNLPAIDNEEHFVYQNVTKKQDVLSCPGYLFRGWIIDKNDRRDMTIVNDDIFVMPGHDVTIRATWSKEDLVKSMDGTVHEKTTLYSVLEKEANIGTYARKFTGNHQDSMDNNGTSNIYYYYASNRTNAETIIKEKNNVIFANHCWQMIRTTDTGGVKLLYNGEPEDGKCMNAVSGETGRGNHVGYAGKTSNNLSGTYYYGTDYTFEDGKFKLAGTVTPQEITSGNAESKIPTLAGKYTCRGTEEESTCSTLYLIYDYYYSTYAYMLSLNSSSHYSQFGELQFNNSDLSLSDVGYMHNTRYTAYQKTLENYESMKSSQRIYLYPSDWYANSVTWGTPVANRYNLDSPYQLTSSSDYSTIINGYTFGSSYQSYTSNVIYYIVDVSGSYYYYVTLRDNERITDLNYTFGDSYQENADGTYTVMNRNGSDPTTFNVLEWDTYRGYVLNKYVCKKAVNNSCSELWYVTSNSGSAMGYVKTSQVYKYSNSFEYKLDPSDGKYKYFLSDDNKVEFWNFYDWSNSYSLRNHHYTCWDASGVCEEVSFIYMITSNTQPFYINIRGGKNIETVLQEMLFLDNNDYHVNTNDSIIKSGIDAWYKKYILTDFDNFVEDTIYCNERRIRRSYEGGWGPNYELNDVLDFNNVEAYFGRTYLTCPNDTDKFSTLNDKAHLTYKVGLATLSEMYLLGNSSLRKTGEYYWLMSPESYYIDEARVFGISYYGELCTGDLGTSYDGVTHNLGVRPVISLIPEIEYKTGDGSMERPYFINTDDTD